MHSSKINHALDHLTDTQLQAATDRIIEQCIGNAKSNTAKQRLVEVATLLTASEVKRGLWDN